MRSLRSARLRSAIAPISSATFIRSTTCSASPAASSRTMRPSTSTRTRSATAAATGVVGDHHDRLAEVVDRACAAAPSTSSLERESRLPVGSSAKTTAGSLISARAIATRCCWPPESSAGRWSRRSARPTDVDQPVEAALVGVAAGELQRQEDVLARVEHRQQVEELEDEADLVAAQLGELGVVERPEVDAVDDDGPRGRAVEAREAVHQRRLARARRAHDRREPPPGEADADAVERAHGGLALAEGTANVDGADDRLGVRGVQARAPFGRGRRAMLTPRGRPLNWGFPRPGPQGDEGGPPRWHERGRGAATSVKGRGCVGDPSAR